MEKYLLGFLALIVPIVGKITYNALRTYFNEKLKNVATLQSIGEITEKVESIKHELSVISNKKNVLFIEEKAALHEFLSAWLIWYNVMTSLKAEYTSYNYEVEQYMNNVDNFHNKCHEELNKGQMTLSKIDLFVEDREVFKSAEILFKNTFDLQKITHKYLWDLFYINHELAHVNNQLSQLTSRVRLFRTGGNTPMNTSQHEATLLINSINQRQQDLTKRFESESNDKYKEVLSSKEAFVNLSRAYIRKDIPIQG